MARCRIRNHSAWLYRPQQWLNAAGALVRQQAYWLIMFQHGY